MMVYFLFNEPANQIFLYRISKDDIDALLKNKQQASTMLQSVLQFITKVRFVGLTNSTSTSYVSEYVSSSDPEVLNHRRNSSVN